MQIGERSVRANRPNQIHDTVVLERVIGHGKLGDESIRLVAECRSNLLGIHLAVDVLAGNVDFMFGNLPDFLPYIKSGKIKAIGTTYLTRAPLAPEIPTIAEQGFPTFEPDSWYGIVAPSSMTKDAVDRMNQVINRALQDPAVKKNLGDRGIEIIGGTPAKFQEHIQSEILKYERIVKSANMQAD